MKHLSNCSTLEQAPGPQTLDQAGNTCQRQTLQLITKIRKLLTKKFYNIGPSYSTPVCMVFRYDLGLHKWSPKIVPKANFPKVYLHLQRDCSNLISMHKGLAHDTA